MSDLPEPVQRFLDRHITSVMQLEVLLALRASGEQLSTRQLTRSLGGSVDQALLCFAELERSKLVEQIDAGTDLCARYVGTPAVDADLAAVADEYARRKARVIAFVLRDRDNPLQSFSDAFKLRRDR